MTPGDRLKASRKNLGLSLKALGDKIGYSHGHLSMVERGEKDVSSRLINLLQLSLGINPAYITNGEKPMFIAKGQAKLDEPGEDPDEAELLLAEFGAWVRRTVLKSPELTDDIATGIRRLINEVEDKRLPRAAPQDEQGNKAAS